MDGEEYDSEEMDESDQEAGVVNKANVLNYKSDDSSQQSGSDSQESEEEEPARANEAWGKNKQSYYGKDGESSGDSSAGEEDQQQEALRLQEIRRKKLAK